jgi:hypothetical protein
VLAVLAWFLLVQGVPRAADKGLHWDVASYLRAARQDVEQMPLTARYDWTEVRAQLAQGDATDHYRKLARYGHIWIMAQIYRIAGPGLSGLQSSMTAYSAVLALSLVLLLLLLHAAARLFLPEAWEMWIPGAAALAAILFLASGGMVQYLNGHLVSEVPTLFLLAVAGALQLRGLRAVTPARAGVWGALSGLFLGALYVVRLESVWTNAALLIALAAVFARDAAARPRLLAVIIGSACTGLSVVALWMAHVGPIGSPHYFLQYANAYAAKTPIEFSRQNILFALGPAALLLPLTLFARPWRVVAAGWIAFALAAFPLATVYLREGPIEARMFGVLLPPMAFLLWLAALGAARVVLRPTASRRAMLAAACLLPALFAGLGLALQSERGRATLARWSGSGPWAVVPHEALNFHLGDLPQVAAVLDAAKYPALQLLRAPEFTWQVYASFLSYLQQMPFSPQPTAPAPFADRPGGPWFALVGAENPVEDLQRATLSQYRELDKRQVQVQVPYQGPDLVLFQVGPAPAAP